MLFCAIFAFLCIILASFEHSALYCGLHVFFVKILCNKSYA